MSDQVIRGQGDTVSAVILQPARHGFVIDLKHGTRRCQVRVFEFEEQMVPGIDATCEMPVRMNEAEAQARLRQAQEMLRERICDGKEGGAA